MSFSSKLILWFNILVGKSIIFFLLFPLPYEQGHEFNLACVEPVLMKDGEVLDGWWDSYPFGRHARVVIPVD